MIIYLELGKCRLKLLFPLAVSSDQARRRMDPTFPSGLKIATMHRGLF
jgi:hypothetical protein